MGFAVLRVHFRLANCLLVTLMSPQDKASMVAKDATIKGMKVIF